jgi:predicted dehydrogenase
MNWGIIGYGEIAPTFVKSLLAIKDQCLFAIGSVSKHSFLIEENLYPNTIIYSNYEQIYTNPDIDIVYICTTNNLHKQNVLSALKAGKHVLCEKPLGVNKKDVMEMIAVARDHNRFLMEGMWTRFLPAYVHFKKMLVLDVVGEVNFIRADFGFYNNWGKDRRLRNPDLFGGTILDNADYNVFLCQDICGNNPIRIIAAGKLTDSNVEESAGIMLQYPSGAIAQLFSSFQQNTLQEALIYGKKGHFHLKEYWHGSVVELFVDDKNEKWDFPLNGNGFEYEINEVISCITDNKIESSTISHAMSVEVADILDNVLEQIKNQN